MVTGAIRVWLGGVLLLLGVACRPPPADILLLTVDTLRADHVGLNGYDRPTTPNIDRWFADGAIYEHSYSTEASTSPSVVSMLSGLQPFEHRVRLHYQLIPADLQLIPDWLPREYQKAAFITNPVLSDEAMGIARYFDHYDDQLEDQARLDDAHRRERRAEDATNAVLEWLDTQRDPDRPLFLWVHYIDPHGPYDPPESWPRTFRHDGVVAMDSRFLNSEQYPDIDDALELVDLYDEEIAYNDAQIGRLLEGYAERFEIEKALIIFTADHGESMMDHEVWFAHSYHVYDEIVRVPLLVMGPGVEPGRHPVLTSGIDVVPTVLGFAGVGRAGHAGFDLRRASAIPHDRTVFSEATLLEHWRTGVRGQEKWMVSSARAEREPVQQRYYDLENDPDELSYAASDSGDEVPAQLLRLLREDPDPGGVPQSVRWGQLPGAPKVAPRATPEQLERLRGLGYVE